jgi:hypothetical protein
VNSGRQDVCPACSGDNRCAIARTGDLNAECWCMSVQIPADVTQPLPVVGTPCLCRKCATGNEEAPARAGASSSIER